MGYILVNMEWFHVDRLTVLLWGLFALVGGVVVSFSLRYMAGDGRLRPFLWQIGALLLSMGVVVSADHLALFCTALVASQALLIRLMIHKQSWLAARNSGILAAKTLLFSSLCVAGACWLLYRETGHTLMSEVRLAEVSVWPLLLLIGGAAAQSALIPFHRWLLSSLNSPTPVSAVMHAGVINGGGILLARFAPLYKDHAYLLTALFVLGVISAVVGSVWKLMQSDVKRQLACSTQAQMGFMLAQCGLGLFAAALTHLLFHSLFKAYLFLSSGSAAQAKRAASTTPSTLEFLAALFCGLSGMISFGWVTHLPFTWHDTSVCLVLIVGVMVAQISLTLFEGRLRRLPLVVLAALACGALYGWNVHLLERWLAPLGLVHPQPLNAIYIIGTLLLVGGWAATHLVPISADKLYVKLLNSSQPHPDTVTPSRQGYAYLEERP